MVSGEAASFGHALKESMELEQMRELSDVLARVMFGDSESLHIEDSDREMEDISQGNVMI